MSKIYPDIEVIEIEIETGEEFVTAVFTLEWDARFFIEKRLESLPDNTVFEMKKKMII